MAETFNGYVEWLGVSSAVAQPNHYELLRLQPFESNPETILTAANVQMAKVRGVRPGPHVDLWGRLLDELGAAKRCLCDSAEKSQYDAVLRAKGWPASIPDSAEPSADVPSNDATAGAKRSPYIEFTGESVSNPLPPQIGAGRIAAGGGAPGNAINSKAVGGSATGSDATGGATPSDASGQSHGGRPAKAWIPPPATEQVWTPPSPRAAPTAAAAAQSAAPTTPAATAPAAPIVVPAPSVSAAKPPSLPSPPQGFPAPGSPTPGSPAPGFPAPNFPAPGFAAPATTFPAATPQPASGTFPFPRPYPPLPMPGTNPPGAAQPTAVPQQGAPQMPFAGQFYPGGAMRPAMNPAFPQFTPAAPFPFASGLPGSLAPQAAVPGFGVPNQPQAMSPQGMSHQAASPQATEPQQLSPADGGNFLDDVLSGPKPSSPSPIDELGIGDSATAPQSARSFAPRSRQRSQKTLIGSALAVVALLAAGLVVAVVLSQKGSTVAESDTTEDASSESPSPSPRAAPDAPAPKMAGNQTSVHNTQNSKTNAPTAQANDLAGTKPRATKSPAETSPTTLVLQPTAPTKTAPKPVATPVVDPVKAARLAHLLADARRKLGQRDVEAASRLVADAKALAATGDQTDRVQRMNTLVRYVGEFWGAVHDALKSLKPTDEIEIGTDRAVVVEKDDQSLTIRMAGGNHRLPVAEMPGGFAVALANRWLDPSKPANKVFIGAFYAVDLKSNRSDDAKQLWTEAAAAGVPDGTYLLPLLNPEPAESDTRGAAMDSLPPVPDEKAIERVQRKVRTEFDALMVSATTPTKQAELIQRLFEAADGSDDPVRRYVLCLEARDVAAKAGRAKLMIAAIDRISREFRVDALDMKADTFANFPPTTAPAGREVTRAALELVDEAVSTKRIALASRLAQEAVTAAQASNGNDLLKRAMQRSKEIEALANKNMAADPR